MTDIIAWVVGHWDLILGALGALATLASAITALTPTPKDDEWLKRVLGWFSFLLPKDHLNNVKMPLTRLPGYNDPLIVKRQDDRDDDRNVRFL